MHLKTYLYRYFYLGVSMFNNLSELGTLYTGHPVENPGTVTTQHFSEAVLSWWKHSGHQLLRWKLHRSNWTRPNVVDS